jgi:hypothetical protein
MASITATEDSVFNNHNFIEQGQSIELKLLFRDKEITIIITVEKVINDDDLIYTLIFKGDYPFSTELRYPLSDPTEHNTLDLLIKKANVLIREIILVYIRMDYPSAIKNKKINEIISRTMQTVSIADGTLFMINPKKMDEIISDCMNSGSGSGSGGGGRSRSVTMSVKDIRIKCSSIGLLSQFNQLITSGHVTSDQAKLFINDEEKIHMISLMSGIPPMYEKIYNKNILLSYIEYVTNRCEYTPLGINIKYYVDTPEEITGEFNI